MAMEVGDDVSGGEISASGGSLALVRILMAAKGLRSAEFPVAVEAGEQPRTGGGIRQRI